MARLPRLDLPGYVHLLVQRGNNRQSIFAQAQDYDAFKNLLDTQARANEVALHAYLLMGSDFHLLATPRSAGALAKMMQSLGRSYVRYFNRRTGRSGTLWEGRYRSTVIQAEQYLLAAMAYLDLSPVREGLVEDPAAYAWSSHSHYAGRGVDRLITAHPLLWQLGNTPFAREIAYSQLVGQGIDPAQQDKLADGLLHGWPLGDSAFMEELGGKTNRPLSRGRPGRPPNKNLSVPN